MSRKAKQIIFIIVSVLWFAAITIGSTVIVLFTPRFSIEDLSRFSNSGITDTADISVTSFNIRCIADEKDENNNWAIRKERVVAHMKTLDSDIFGLQEVTPEQFDYIVSKMQGYKAVGENRALRSEKNCILYRADKFELIETRTFWLSDTPYKVSKFTDSGCYRICTYAVLKVKSTGMLFAACNTHLDNRSGDARVEQARRLIQNIDGFSIPHFITGDFNDVKGSPTYAAITSVYMDSKLKAEIIDDFDFTYHAFSGTAVSRSKKYIDFCFVLDKIDVHSYSVDTETVDGKVYSDHFSVTVSLTLKP